MSRRETTREDRAGDEHAESATTNGTPRVAPPKAWIEFSTPAAHEERAHHRERAHREHQADVPDLQHPPVLLDHQRVQEGGAGEPGHQRGVLDRVPAPVAAPAELRVGPAGAEQDPDAEEQPGGEREPADRRIQSASTRRASSAPIANAKGSCTACTPSTASGGGSSSSGSAAAGPGPRLPAGPGACSNGGRRRPSARRRSRQDEQDRRAQAATSRIRLRPRNSARLDHSDSSQAHSSSEPSCEDHAARAR